MKTFRSVAVVAVVIVLATAPSSFAAAPGSSGGHSGGSLGGHSDGHFEGHGGFEGHHGSEHHGDFDRGHHDRGGIIGYPYYWGAPYYSDDPSYSAPTQQSYWYYCTSYGAYYPYVGSCPEAWVPVPAS
jgi:hypothetical protein